MDGLRLLRFPINNLVNPAARPVHAVVVVAFAGIGPVGDEDVAVGAGEEVDAAEPFVFGLHEVRRVFAGVAATFADELVHVNAVAVQVAGEHGTFVFLWPDATLINQHADMGMTATELVGLA